MPYGAFVDIGGIEGLLHLNNLSWEKVESVEDMLSEGQEVQVYVLDIDKENKKFALALKRYKQWSLGTNKAGCSVRRYSKWRSC